MTSSCRAFSAAFPGWVSREWPYFYRGFGDFFLFRSSGVWGVFVCFSVWSVLLVRRLLFRFGLVGVCFPPFLANFPKFYPRAGSVNSCFFCRRRVGRFPRRSPVRFCVCGLIFTEVLAIFSYFVPRVYGVFSCVFPSGPSCWFGVCCFVSGWSASVFLAFWRNFRSSILGQVRLIPVFFDVVVSGVSRGVSRLGFACLV